MSRDAGIFSRSGSAIVEQNRRMSPMAAKKTIFEAVNTDSLARIDAHFRRRRTIVKLVLDKKACGNARRLQGAASSESASSA